jgi:hypothetical protein
VTFQADWPRQHCRYFRIAGITVCVKSDLNLDEIVFKPELASFQVEGPGDDNVTLRHFFQLPDLAGQDLGMELYRRAPWAISRNRESGTWFYRGILPDGTDAELHRVAVFDATHTHATIYSPPSDERQVRQAGWYSLSLFPTDQVWLAPLLADRHAVLLHAGAAILNGAGLLFVGHSEAGKSTTMTLLKNAARPGASHHAPLQVEILCDDRNIVRRWKDGWRVHGTWSHGDVPDVSSSSAPLRAILFLKQGPRNQIAPLTSHKEIWTRLLATLVKPMVTAEWWRKELDVLEQIVNEVPCYIMHFDKSGRIVAELVALVERRARPENDKDEGR